MMASKKETMAEEARRLGISPQRVQARRKNALGLCSRCPVAGGKRVHRAGLCRRHYEDHLARSRERMARLYSEGRHPDQIRKRRRESE